MKLIIITDSNLNHDTHKVTKDSEVTTFHISQWEKELKDMRPLLCNVTDLYVVGFDTEVVTMGLFTLLEDDGGALCELLGIEPDKLPKFNVILTRTLPNLSSGDMLVSNLVGGHVAVTRVNYDPKYVLDKLPENFFGALKLAERCKLTTDYGTVTYTPLNNATMGFSLNFHNGAMPLVCGVESIMHQGWGSLLQAEIHAGKIKPPHQEEVSSYTALVGRVKSFWEELCREAGKFYTTENGHFKALNKLYKGENLEEEFEDLYSYLEDKVLLGWEKDLLWAKVFADVASLSTYSYPYPTNFYSGIKDGLVAFVKEEIEHYAIKGEQVAFQKKLNQS